MVKREVIGAHYGLRGFMVQRVSAVVMTVYTLAALITIASLPRFDHASWKALWATPSVRYATFAFVVAVLLHAWVGLRNVFMDYVHPTVLRLTLYIVVIVALVMYGAWSIQILWGA
ncbi:MAG: succinate dehydrogenase, hydrophobic membrane anchor protein [Rhodospirillaceae bacterium]